jgi:hypothetical protein
MSILSLSNVKQTFKQICAKQAAKIHVMLVPALVLMTALAAIVLCDGIINGSIAVILMGLFFMGFVAWYFFTY